MLTDRPTNRQVNTTARQTDIEIETLFCRNDQKEQLERNRRKGEKGKIKLWNRGIGNSAREGKTGGRREGRLAQEGKHLNNKEKKWSKEVKKNWSTAERRSRRREGNKGKDRKERKIGTRLREG